MIAESFSGHPDIDAIWTYPAGTDAEPADVHYVAPDGCIDLIFELVEESVVGAIAFGPSARFQWVQTSAQRAYVGVRFRPGRGALGLPIPAAALASVSAPLGHLVNPSVLPRRIAGAQTVLDLVEQLRVERPPAWLADALALGEARVAPLAKTLRIDPRTLHRGFLRWVGLSPKKFLRLERARAAAELLVGGAAAAEVAARLDYADQAHLTRDLRAAFGVTPGAAARVRHVSDFFKIAMRAGPRLSP